VPFDAATSGRPGSRLGPGAIRQISTNLAWEGCRWPWDFDLRQRLNVVDCGDLVYAFGDSQDLSDKLQAHAEKLLANGKRMMTFGGDHYVTLPLLRAHAKHFGKMALVHFDAHTDTYSNGPTFDHGTMFFHAAKQGIVDPTRSIQIGMRTRNPESHGYRVLDARWLHEKGVEACVAAIRERVGDRVCYVSFDIDFLDPSFAPGTGTPVVGGFSTHQALMLIRGLAGLNIIGMDVVEVSPPFDLSELTSLAGASIAQELLCAYASRFKPAHE